MRKVLLFLAVLVLSVAFAANANGFGGLDLHVVTTDNNDVVVVDPGLPVFAIEEIDMKLDAYGIHEEFMVLQPVSFGHVEDVEIDEVCATPEVQAKARAPTTQKPTLPRARDKLHR